MKTHMPSLRLLILLTVLIFVVGGAAIFSFDIETISAYGSLLSGVGSLLAVVWFSASLWYQSVQLKEQKTQLNEQREQFTREFHQLQEAGRRDAIQMAKTILDYAEHQAIRHHGSISAINELPGKYLQFAELKPLMESNDPAIVLEASNNWMRKEGAALALMNGIKGAAEVYFRALGQADVDYNKKPEEFVYIYGPRFWRLPFFAPLEATSTLLSELMVNLEPGRRAAVVAALAASAKQFEEIMHMDKLRETISEHIQKGYPLPKIAEGII